MSQTSPNRRDWSLRSTIGQAAKLTVREDGPRFVKWSAFAGGAVTGEPAS
jgi:hypothetical protein